ncbi:MAG: Ig-like domain-containing protein [Clostridia bacterium]|nr:Ig-like domain-containing protein [Clostridia bacterium]MBQ3938569.1 Ig-like domain-containing protein [Clostridia bacterium]MBQ5487876.1 Ig-like domain-containing protein [Clostridia bacterium]
MKRFLSLAVAVVLLFSVFGSSVSAKTETGTKPVTSGDVVIDDDGSDGYSGDYVVIYNPSTSGYGTASTGNMSGLIETEVGEDAVHPMPAEMADRPYRIDVDGAMAEQAAGLEKPVGGTSVRTSFNVGDTHTFSLNSSYCPLPSSNVQFKVLAKGEHCYIWTPTSTASNVYPLDQIDPTFGDICAAEFDSKFDLMQSSFGNHENGSQGDGRLNILYYNIDDGWEPGQGYVAGFFSASDLYSNNMPILNIDTYPGVYYVRPSGEVVIDVTGTYNTMVHEYQHLINYSECGSADTWINECMSAAAEEICYPGSSVIPRIQSWLNYRFNDNDDWLNPPQEHEYQSAWSLHNGYSMYDWSNYLEMNDRLALYAQVSFFAQYIFTQYGNTTFRSILLQLAQGRSFPQAFQNVTGQDTSEFVGNFRVALTANTSPDLYEGVYGFVPQEGYDPSMYHDVENPFNLLAPVVFTGSSCAISAGGAITVKPVDGVYNPPAGAAGTLRYFGVSLNAEPPAPVALTDIALAPKTASIYSGTTVSLSAVREPADANNYELEWTSSAPAVATVAGNNRKAVVTGVSAGAATITVRAHDLLNDRYYTDTAVITVLGAPTLEDALNVENGTLTFDNTGSSYPWAVDLADTSGGRLAAKSTNEGVSSSRSSFSLTVNMNAGDTMTFDWKVSSESNYDILKFYVGSTEREHISGSVGWTTVSYTATATGSVTFSWEFYKDYSVNTGSDCGWVDNIFVPGYVEEPVDFLPGDIDQDGEVTVTDALLAMRYAMGLITLTDLQLEIGNVDGDETLTISDALMILRAAMGLIEL